jgi:hypothetical protein
VTLSDLLERRDRKIAIRIEIFENGAITFLEAEYDFFATDKIIKEATGKTDQNPPRRAELHRT